MVVFKRYDAINISLLAERERDVKEENQIARHRCVGR